MTLFNLLLHLLNFLAPALAVAGLTAAVGPWLVRPGPGAPGRVRQGLYNAAAGVVALGIGLIAFDQDGKMASYAALVLACATSQWLGSRAWRR